MGDTSGAASASSHWRAPPPRSTTCTPPAERTRRRETGYCRRRRRSPPEPPDRFEYDPASPVRTIGGRLCCAGLEPGPFDQRPNESRADVLVYSTPALPQDVEVTGFITLELYAATSAADTDFTAMLVDVDDTGFARYLADGSSGRGSASPRKRPAPSSLAGSTSTRSTCGRRATCSRPVTASACTWRAATSPVQPQPEHRGEDRRRRDAGEAKQTIYHDAEHPSAIVLPIIPRAGEKTTAAATRGANPAR